MTQFPDIPNYRIEKKFGRGAMGTVYLAFQKKLERHVALKVLLPALSEDPETTQRFMTEAKIGAQLQHSNIVSIYDVGKHQGYYYFAMEYLERSLKEFMKSFRDSRMKPEIALDILKQMANALDYAHRQGVIHRDIKPANILLRQDGTPVLVDFGIAKLMDADNNLTKTGTSIGTPHYMSPEQIQGMDIDGRSDIYSLGVVFFEMLQGNPPYEGGDSIAVAVKHVKEPIPRLGKGLESFQPIVDGMMAKNKHQRITSGTQLNTLIQNIQLDNLSPEKEKEDTIIRRQRKTPEDISIIDEVPENEYRRYRKLKRLVIPVFVSLFVLAGLFGLWHIYQSNNSSEASLWKLAREKGLAEGYHQYLQEYPDGKYSLLAKKRISQLEKRTRSVQQGRDQSEKKAEEKKFQDLISQAKQALQEDKIRQAREILLMAKAISDTAEIRELERNIKEREIALQPSFHLRQQPRNMTIQGTQSMLSKQGFFDIYKNKNKRFTNHFTFQTIQGKKVVVDRSTGLMWHGSGSGHYMNYAAARDWIAGLNRNRYAGYSNWRIPTLEEAASLLETRRNNQGLFLNSIFLSKARSIWTCDTLGNEIWIVYFEHGYVDVNWPQFNSYVFPVRSLY